MDDSTLDQRLAAGEHRAQPELLMPHVVLSRIAADLAAKYEGVVSRQTVERCVFESYAALRRTSRVQAHLTSLASRFAADRLRALAQSDGAIAKDVPEVLFVCVHNAGRSQMAAGLLTHRAGPRPCPIGGFSAGPFDQPHRGRGDDRDRDRPGQRLPQTADRRCRRRRRCRGVDGLR